MGVENEIAILIPAYNPNGAMAELVGCLSARGFFVLVVDDGSDDDHRSFFDPLRQMENVEIVNHPRNKGKGAALKTGIRALARQKPYWGGVVTVDADGQHDPVDIARVAETVSNHPESLVLGVRDLDRMPARSRFGNKLTKALTAVFCNVSVSDTQTGLRGFSLEKADVICDLAGDRFEFEMSMIVRSADIFSNIIEVPIATIYEVDNPSSHFNPLLDSVRVYSVLLKTMPRFVAVSVSSFVIDYALFVCLSEVLGLFVVVSNVAARLVSSVYNYVLNRCYSFKVKGRSYTPFRYFALAGAILLLDTVLMWALVDLLGMPGYIVKVAVGFVLWMVSYGVQSWLAARDERRR